MTLPFTIDQFLDVFARYNSTIWPAQIGLTLAALVAIGLALRKSPPSRLIGLILAFLWAWTGIVYHLMFFSSINPAANLFGALCIVQSALFLVFGVLRQELLFGFDRSFYAYTGALFLLYALLIYPLLGYQLGHVYPQSPTFGAPCPTTIFTFGLLLWTTRPVRRTVLIIPLAWAVIGFAAALNFGILEDIGLLVAGICGTTLLILRSRRRLNVPDA